MKPFSTLLCWLALTASALAANVKFYVGPTGQTLYVRVNENGTYVARALTEGTSGGEGTYYATEAQLVSAGLDTASGGNGFDFTVFVGSPSTTATDQIVAFGTLPWDGQKEVDLHALIEATKEAAESAADAAGNAESEATDAKVAAQSADTKLDDKPTAAQIWATLTSGLNTAGSIGKRIVDNLDAKVSEVEGGGGGGFDATERAQILAALSIGEDTGVPTAQTFKVKRVDGQLRCTAIVPKDVGETFDVLVDFRDVLASGDAIKAEVDGGIEAIALIDDGNEGEQIECDAFDDATEADVWMNAAIRLHDVSGGTVGQKDRFRVQARTVDGKLLSVPCTIQVTDAGAP